MGAVYIDRLLQASDAADASCLKIAIVIESWQHREDRVFLFVFGGRDSTYEDDELAYKNAVLPGFSCNRLMI